MINKNSLQARIATLSKEKGVASNTILQYFFFDAFLRRLSKSKYSKNFIFKGGFLLSSNLGIDYRATMDIDFLLKSIILSKENLVSIISEIININVDDNVVFSISDISEIRQDDEYGGFSVSLLGKLENVKVTFGIDVATGDPITPNSSNYNYKCLFDSEQLNFLAYNYETILAEKIQTILNRGTLNSRSKDFYDLYIIYKMRWDDINVKTLKAAFDNTCSYRKTIFNKEQACKILISISSDEQMQNRWSSYKNKNCFARGINFTDIIDIIAIMFDIIFK